MDSASAVFKDIQRLFGNGYIKERESILECLPRLNFNDNSLREFFRFCASSDGNWKLASAQSFVIFQCEAFYVRINLWLAQPKIPPVAFRKFDDYFSVDLCHNHPFDFFTVGIFGPGYSSEFFQTDDDISDLSIGSIISIKESWSVTLHRGSALFVGRDSTFHTQFAPDKFSMSLNIIPSQDGHGNTKQYCIDRQTMAVCNIL